MLKKILSHPLMKTAAIFILFFSIPIVGGLFVNYQSIGGYLSPAILLFLTWQLYKKEGRTLAELGLPLKKRNLYFLPIGLLLGILFFTALLFMQTLSNNLTIVWNKSANYTVIFGGVFLLLQGVLNEELIFRGYCFKKTIDQTGLIRANLIFAFLFLVWHWLAFNAWGNYALMLGLITTSFGHFFFSTALLSARTLYLPIGIHVGNNWASHYLFSVGMTGTADAQTANDALFNIATSQPSNTTMHAIANYGITIGWMLFCTWLVWKWRKHKSMTPAAIA